METTAVTQYPALTDVTQYPALTDVTQGIEVWMYDIVQSNQNQATWWNSVSHFCNNIIDAVRSFGAYIVHILDVADVFIQENAFPIALSTGITIALAFTIVDFYRGR